MTTPCTPHSSASMLQRHPGVAFRHRARQRGVVLWIVIALTLILGVLTTSVSTSVGYLFKTARNDRDLAVARQAAEAALRDAEVDVTCQQYQSNGTLIQVVRPTTVNTHCVTPAPTCPQLMPTTDSPGIRSLGRVPSGAIAAVNWGLSLANCPDGNCAVEFGSKTLAPTLSSQSIAKPPRYQVDVLDTGSQGDNEALPLFRITARGYGATAATVVELQEVYRPCP